MPRHIKTSFVCAAVFCALCVVLIVPEAFGLAQSAGAGGSNAQAVHQLGETGKGVNVGLIASRNVRITHEAFEDSNGVSHAFNYDFSGDGVSWSLHDTRAAGIAVSRGDVSHPNDLGAAPGVDIYSARAADDSDMVLWTYLTRSTSAPGALDKLIDDLNCRVIFTVMALGNDPNGNSAPTLLYDYYADACDVVFANPAGNGYSTIWVWGDAYNGITTGGLILNDPSNQYVYRKAGTKSSSGPTSDGRRKPDIAAPSQWQTTPSDVGDTVWSVLDGSLGQTSFSTPHTAGVAALLLGLADDNPEPDDSHNEVIKAVIVNSTFPNIDDETGSWTNPADPNNTWDQDRGYGRLDALRAYELLDANRVATDVNIAESKGWAYDTVGTLQEHVYRIYGQRNDRLVATLTWNRRVEWVDERRQGQKNGIIEPDELHPYLANLDLVVYGPNDSNAIFSEAKFGLPPKDNLEKCDVLLKSTGYHIVKVVNKSSSESPDYALAFEIWPPIVGDFEPIDYVVDYTDLSGLMLEWLSSGAGLEGDLIGEGNTVDGKDFSEFGDHWFEADAIYSEP